MHYLNHKTPYMGIAYNDPSPPPLRESERGHFEVSPSPSPLQSCARHALIPHKGEEVRTKVHMNYNKSFVFFMSRSFYQPTFSSFSLLVSELICFPLFTSQTSCTTGIFSWKVKDVWRYRKFQLYGAIKVEAVRENVSFAK